MSDEKWVMQIIDTTDKVDLIARVVSGEADALPLYLQTFDPLAHGGRGEPTFTADPDQAMHFDSYEALLEFWRQQSTIRPLRPDGMPNRPLTAWSASGRKLSAVRRVH
jgi:hypothetical protein